MVEEVRAGRCCRGCEVCGDTQLFQEKGAHVLLGIRIVLEGNAVRVKVRVQRRDDL